MKIIISGKNFSVTEALSERIHKKVGKLTRYFDDNVEAQVRLSLERGCRNIVEVTIPFHGDLLRAEVCSDDMYTSVDRVLAKLERQIHKNRTRFEKRMRSGAFGKELPEYAFAPYEPDDAAPAKVSRVKHIPLRPMFVEDAIAQMELLGHNFFMFLNANTDKVSLVYRRDDGDYGLMEPEV